MLIIILLIKIPRITEYFWQIAISTKKQTKNVIKLQNDSVCLPFQQLLDISSTRVYFLLLVLIFNWKLPILRASNSQQKTSKEQKMREKGNNLKNSSGSSEFISTNS